MSMDSNRSVVPFEHSGAHLDRAQERWLGGLAPTTRRGYSADVRAWLEWARAAGVDPARPTGRDLAEHLASLGHLAVSTRARRLAAVLSFYAWLRDEGLSAADPRPPRSARPRVRGLDAARLGGLDAAQAQRIMAAADAASPRSAALVALLLTTGLRISEALSLTVADLAGADAGGRCVVTVTGKGSKTRSVVVPPLAVERLARLIDGREGPARLFITRTGSPWLPREAADHLARLGRKAGLPGIHPHQLRHTAATLALTGGSNVEAVRAMLGHSSLATTQRYVIAAGALDASPAYALAATVAPE